MNQNSLSDINVVIARYLAGEATSEEIDHLLQWLEESDEHRRDFFGQKDAWHALHPAFDPAGIDTAAAECKVLARAGISGGKSRCRRSSAPWLRMVAACVLPLCVLAAFAYYMYARPSQAQVPVYTISTAYGYTMEADLPDGTHVWLNANSTLRYPAEFRAAEREVELMGEAYFSVEADSARPFLVHTADMTVKATGTQFDVNAYDISPEACVMLVEGKVAVAAAGRSYTMSEGDYLTLADGRVRMARAANLERYCAWRDGILIFDNDCLKDICARLEQIYNVEFTVDPAVEAVNFHVILKGENISEIMRMMELSAPISCELGEHPDMASGNMRQRIAITPRK